MTKCITYKKTLYPCFKNWDDLGRPLGRRQPGKESRRGTHQGRSKGDEMRCLHNDR